MMPCMRGDGLSGKEPGAVSSDAFAGSAGASNGCGGVGLPDGVESALYYGQ